MKRIAHAMRKVITLFLFIVASCMTHAQDTVYVSCNTDENIIGSGTKEEPYKTLSQALHISKLYIRTELPLYVLIESGTYTLTHPLVIRQPYSRPVIIKGIGRTKPELVCGRPITQWKHFKGDIYCASVASLCQNNHFFEQLYINGVRAQLCKTPNDGWFEVQDFVENKKSSQVIQQVKLTDADFGSLFLLDGKTQRHMRFEFIHNWDVTRWYANTIDRANATVTFTDGPMPELNPIKKGSRVIVYNFMKALDKPGEWYLDRQQKMVYYIPRPGEDMNKAVGMAPILQHAIEICGEELNPVRNITFTNLSFSYIGHNMPAAGEYPGQSAAELDAAINIEYAENIMFTNCHFQHTGAYVFWLKNNCNNNTIRQCLFTDVGGGGIKLGTTTPTAPLQRVSRGNVFDNNIMFGLGREVLSSVGILVTKASDNTITHNDIADLYYTGISVGWTWGYNENWKYNPSVNNIISHNHIHHIGWGMISDLGGIYTLGVSPGTVISNNSIHDILSYDYGGWGIYLDEGSSFITVTNNLVYKCKNGGFHQHYGQENTITNNIFALGDYYQLQFTRPENHVSFTFKHNIVYQESGKTLSGKWNEGCLAIDSNLYYNTEGKYDFAGKNWEEWKKVYDKNSLLANPQFSNPWAGDFNLSRTTPVISIGFKPFSLTDIGVYGDSEWTEKAKQNNTVVSQSFTKSNQKHTRNRELFD